MVENAGSSSCLTAIRVLRVSLLDELEGSIDSLLDALTQEEVFTRDDREEALCLLGPRARVRKVLDILECKGEEAAKTFFSICNHQKKLGTDRKDGGAARPWSVEYDKLIRNHKDVLRRRSECMLFYNTRCGEKILFSDHYVDLLLVDGHRGLEIKRHEVLTFGQNRLALQHKSVVNRKITADELFSRANAKHSVKKVLVAGVAGIGKTILVQKILFDFGANRSKLAFDFIVHMSFRDLNLIDKPTSFRDMVLRKNRHLVRDLDGILAHDGDLLIILDGFDEFGRRWNGDLDVVVTEPGDVAEVGEVVGSLMQGELLPNASVLLTSRPAAIGHVPVGCIDRFVLIVGFSLADVRDFFSRYFQDRDLAAQMFALISENELMLTLCYIPAFCNIVCCILKESKGLCGESPRTMTDIYVQYLVALLCSKTHARSKASPQERTAAAAQQLPDVVFRLGRLAFQKLMEHQTLFYGSNPDAAVLEGCSLFSTFLDETVTQEPGCTEVVYSFVHLTVQEFFAALYCALTDDSLPGAPQHAPGSEEGSGYGHLDLFNRFLSGILSERNAQLLSRQVGLCFRKETVENYRQRIVRELRMLCENGAHILNHLHCLFEQQDSCLALTVQPKALRINVSDEALSQMDFNSLKYFLNLTRGNISELDLTGTGVTHKGLRDIQPLLLRCENLWLGENDLDMDAVQVIVEVLQESDSIINLGIGWSNIGDDELLAISGAIRLKGTLKELWMEGNRASSRGLRSLCDLVPNPLRKVVAIWNDVNDAESLCGGESIIVNFTDDSSWNSWGEWVFKRCEVSTNDKLVTVLRKVCNISVHCLEVQWAKALYRKLAQLVKDRVDTCTEEDMRKKLKMFDSVLNL
ncbi:protein NLRC3-like [Brachionichthys hirsutus]|uniref:protein NLRC3-like n=1 Tax=Brachionichthys hirsutus TaxID=412623 RepID=UPI0036053A47